MRWHASGGGHLVKKLNAVGSAVDVDDQLPQLLGLQKCFNLRASFCGKKSMTRYKTSGHGAERPLTM